MRDGTGSGTGPDGPGVRHADFRLERVLDAPPGRVFAAFAEDGPRRRWFRLPGSGATYRHDFRVGGGETGRSVFRGMDTPPEHLAYRLRYLDITPHRRILYTHEAVVDDVPRWVSLVTVQLGAEGTGTRLVWTEQVAFLAATGDGSHDLPHLRGATSLRLNGLALALREPAATGVPER